MNNGQEDNRDIYLYGDDGKSAEPTPILTGKKKFGSAKTISAILITVAIALLIIIFVLVNNGYVVKNIVLNGESPYSEEKINELLNGYFSERGNRSYFYINTDELSEMMKKELPYIKELKIEKKAPDTLIITVEGESAEAYIEYLGEYYLLNADMKVLEKASHEPIRTRLIKLDIDLPKEIIVGSQMVFPEASRMDPETYVRIYTALSDSGLRERVQYLDIRNKFDLYMRTKEGIDVKIGSVKDIEEKFSTLSKWLSDNPGEIKSTLNIDISVLKKIYISYD